MSIWTLTLEHRRLLSVQNHTADVVKANANTQKTTVSGKLAGLRQETIKIHNTP